MTYDPGVQNVDVVTSLDFAVIDLVDADGPGVGAAMPAQMVDIRERSNDRVTAIKTKAVIHLAERDTSRYQGLVVDPGSRLHDEALRLHAEVYATVGYVHDFDIENERLTEQADPFRRRSQYFVVVDSLSESVTASARMIYADTSVGVGSFPTVVHQSLNSAGIGRLGLYDVNATVEISALVKRRGAESVAIQVLYYAMWQFALANEQQAWLMSCDPRVYARLELMFGTGLSRIGNTAYFEGGYVVPAVLDVDVLKTWLMSPIEGSPQEQRMHASLALLYMGDSVVLDLDATSEVTDGSVQIPASQ